MTKNPINRITILYTTGCSLGCRICGLSDELKFSNQRMSSELIKEIVKDLSNYNFETVVITGGEIGSNLNKLQPFREISDDIEIITSASFITEDNVSAYLKQLRDLGVTKITISYDHYHKERMPRIKKSIDILINNILFKCDEIKQIMIFNCCTPRHYKSIINDLDEILSNNGLNLTGIWYQPAGKNPEPEEFKEVISTLMIYKGENLETKIKIQSSIPLIRGNNFDVILNDNSFSEKLSIIRNIKIRVEEGCYYKQPCIMPDGSVLPCCDFNIINFYKATAVDKYPEGDFGMFLDRIKEDTLFRRLYFENVLEGKGNVVKYCDRLYDFCSICYRHIIRKAIENKEHFEIKYEHLLKMLEFLEKLDQFLKQEPLPPSHKHK